MAIRYKNSSIVKSTETAKGPGYPNDEYLSQIKRMETKQSNYPRSILYQGL
jgi:hypothetical protein